MNQTDESSLPLSGESIDRQITIIPKPELQRYFGGITLLNHHLGIGRNNLPLCLYPSTVFVWVNLEEKN